MSVKFALHGILAMLFLLIFTFCVWYEGSEILNQPWEWKYSTPFSELNTQVDDPKDISNLDYFVYAAKFRPMFPVLMMMTLLYVITLTGIRVCKGSHKKMVFLLFGMGALLLLLSGFVWSSPTIGGNFFTSTFILAGMVYMLAGVWLYFQFQKRVRRVL